jgi:orotidine-5'-phosphate decarboxylase
MCPGVTQPTDNPSGIVIAADVPSLGTLEQLVELAATEPRVYGIKVGFLLALRYGLGRVVETIRQTTALPVIYDHQKAGTDIPQMGPAFAGAVKEAGADEVIIFPLAGPSTLESFLDAALTFELTPYVGLAMSHERYFSSEGGFITESSATVALMIGRDRGINRFVLPATKPSLSRSLAGRLGPQPQVVLAPGIGAQGASIPKTVSALHPHTCLPVVGSAIYQAEDPRVALTSFVDTL